MVAKVPADLEESSMSEVVRRTVLLFHLVAVIATETLLVRPVLQVTPPPYQYATVNSKTIAADTKRNATKTPKA